MNLYQMWNSISGDDKGRRSSYQKAVNFLLKEGFIKIKENRPWFGGRSQKIYEPTFPGLLEYLAILFEEVPQKPEEDRRWLMVKDMVSTFSQYNDYPLFKDLESLEKWLGERDFYECLMALAWWLKNNPPHIKIEVEHGAGDLALFIEKHPLPEHPSVSEAWAHGYTYLFFRYAWGFRRKEEKEGPFISPILHELAQKILGDQIGILKKEVEELEILRKAYGADFPAAATST